MLYVKWVGLVLFSLCVDFVGLFVVPFAIYFGDGKTLPTWANWWDNDREPLGDTDRKADIDAATGMWRGFLRWRWLCLRNPSNNFTRGPWMGFVMATDTKYTIVGDQLTSDQGREGRLFVLTDGAFCFYYVKRWLNIPFLRYLDPIMGPKCVRLFFGWKIQDALTNGQRAQIVFVPNPFMTFVPRA